MGKTDPLDFVDYVSDDRVHDFKLELFEKNGLNNGFVTVSMQLIFSNPDPPVNPTLNYNCKLQVDILEATFLKDMDTFGK